MTSIPCLLAALALFGAAPAGGCTPAGDVTGVPLGGGRGGEAGLAGAAGEGGAAGEAGDDVAAIRAGITPLCEQPAAAAPVKPFGAPLFTGAALPPFTPFVGTIATSPADDRALVLFSQASLNDSTNYYDDNDYALWFDGTAFHEPVLVQKAFGGSLDVLSAALLPRSNKALIAVSHDGDDASLRLLTYDGVALSELRTYDPGDGGFYNYVRMTASPRGDSALLTYEFHEKNGDERLEAIFVGPQGPSGPFVMQSAPKFSHYLFSDDIHGLPSGSFLACTSDLLGARIDCFSFPGDGGAPQIASIVEDPSVKRLYLDDTLSSPGRDRAAVVWAEDRAVSPDPVYPARLRYQYVDKGSFGPVADLAADANFITAFFPQGEDDALAFYYTRSGAFWAPLRGGARPTRLPAMPARAPYLRSGPEGGGYMAYRVDTEATPGDEYVFQDVVTGRYERGAFGPMVAWPLGRSRRFGYDPSLDSNVETTQEENLYLPGLGGALLALSCAGAQPLRAYALSPAGATPLGTLTEAAPSGAQNVYVDLAAGAGDRALSVFKQFYYDESNTLRFDAVVNAFDGREFSAPHRFRSLHHATLASGRFLLVEAQGGAEGDRLEAYVTD